MADFDLSMVIRADGSEAVAEGSKVESTLDGVAAAEKRAGAGAENLAAGSKSAAAAQTELMRRMSANRAAVDGLTSSKGRAAAAADSLGRATNKLSAEEREFERDLARLRAQIDPVGESQRRASRDVDLAATAYQRGRISLEEYNAVLARVNATGTTNVANVGRQRAAYQQLSFQITDIVQGLAMGVNPAIVFGQQAGQVAQAAMLMSDANRDAAVATGALTAANTTGAAAAGANTAATTANTATKAGATVATEAQAVATGSATGTLTANTVATEANVVATGQLAVAKGGLAAFMAGPYGAAIIGVITVLGLLGSKLFSTSNATNVTAASMESAASAADSFGSAQSMLGKIIDLTTGKLRTQNAVLIQTIKLQAQLNLLDAQKRLKDLTGGGGTPLVAPRPGTTGAMGVGGGDIDAAVRAAAAQRTQQAGLDAILKSLGGVVNNTALAQKDPEAYSRQINKAIESAIGGVDRLSASGKVAGQSLESVKKKILDLGTAGNDQAAAIQSLGVIAGGPIPDSLKPDARTRKPKAPPKPKSTAPLEEFGEDARDKIADIVGQFNDLPPAVKQAERTIRDLDDIIDDLSRKKPPGFEETIKSANEAKAAVEGGLIRSFTEAFKAPETLADKARASIGQLDEIISRLGKEKPLGFEQLIKDAEAAKVAVEDGLARPYNDFVRDQEDSLRIVGLMTQGRTDEAEALRIIIGLEKQSGPLTAARKDAILATVQALKAEQRELDVLREKQQKYLNALADVKAAVIGVFTGGIEGIKQLPERLMSAFTNLLGERLFEKFFGDIYRELEDQISGTSVVKDASDRMAVAVDKASGSILKLGDAANAAASKLTGAAGGDGTTAPGDDGEEIVVTGSRIPRDPAGFMSYVIEKLGKGVLGEEAARTIGKFAGKGLEGAVVGAMVAGFARVVGLKLNSTGSSIGGALGGMAASAFGLPPIVGQIAGSILGGLVGNLFSKPKYGTAVLTSATGDVTATGRGDEAIGSATGIGGSVQQGLRNIAEQLGATLGSFDNVVGTWDGRYRVRTTSAGWNGQGGLNFQGNSANNLHDFENESDAIAFAIRDAILDGAVQGLSSAMQQALRSSDDIEAAIREALKVREVEQLIGGLGSTLKKTFDDFDKIAADRVRIARQYGLDIAKVEEINAAQRAKLVEDTLKQRVGSLTDFLNRLKFGDLFEGDASQRRASLLTEIGTVQTQAEAGEEGAADRLAELRGLLVQTSRDAFGTAGSEYATDRTDSISSVQRVIDMENERVRVAAGLQQATTDAIVAGNDLTNETNDLLAVTNARLNEIAAALAGGGSGSSPFSGVDIGSVVRDRRRSVLGLDELVA